MAATSRAFRTVAVTMLVLMGLLAAMPATSAKPGDNGEPGNSGAAHQCKQGGWQSLVREDGTGFGNQGECVSYAAQGGTLAVPDNRGISLSWRYLFQHFGYNQYEMCTAEVTLTNFPAGDHTVAVENVSGVGNPFPIYLTVSVGPDGTGTADTSRAFGPDVLGAWYASTEPGDPDIDAWQAVVTATTADGLSTTSSASC